MAANNAYPTCNKVECGANEDGFCTCLLRNDFGERECPLFKTKEQCEKEKAYCQDRLTNI